MELGSIGEGPRFSQWVEWTARAGYAAKGIVYAVVGLLACRQAAGLGGDVSGAREALTEIAAAPFGKVALAIVTLGLGAYVAWRLVQALLDPESNDSDDSGAGRWAKRAFYLLSAGIYGTLAYYGADLVLDVELGSSGGSGSGGGGWVSRLMRQPWGAWLVGAVGVGVIVRAGVQFFKVWTDSFTEKISAFELGATLRSWVLRASRAGLTARGVAFVIIGWSILNAAWSRDPGEARDLGGALEGMVTRPWLLGAMGLGFCGYAVYQWVKARYRLIGV